MAAELSDDERMVRDWLRKRGYPEPEYEPSIVDKGKKPDFLAIADSTTTPSMLWAEVKSIGPEDSIVALTKFWPVLKEMRVPTNINGHARLHVTKNTREQSVRALLKIFYSKATKHASENVRLIFIQQKPDKKDIRDLVVQGDILQRVWVRGADDEKIAVPNGVIENGSAITTWECSGKRQSRPAYNVFDWLASFDCAIIAHIDPADRPLISISSMSGGKSSLKDRALNAIEDANAQLRNACRVKAVPGLVFVLPLEDHADDQMIAMAAYGDLTVPINGDSNKLGEAFYGRNGALRPDKNTHISALIRLRRELGAATYFPNPFAKYPIEEDASLLTGMQRVNVTFK
jgi:hypothetical protein